MWYTRWVKSNRLEESTSVKVEKRLVDDISEWIDVDLIFKTPNKKTKR
jgi:hypothetical protein